VYTPQGSREAYTGLTLEEEASAHRLGLTLEEEASAHRPASPPKEEGRGLCA